MNSLNIDILIAGILAFTGSIKPGIIGYVTLESYRAFKGRTFTIQGYLIRFATTLGLLYLARGLTNGIVDYQNELMFLVGGFSFIILDIMEERMPGLLRDKADKLINKHK